MSDATEVRCPHVHRNGSKSGCAHLFLEESVYFTRVSPGSVCVRRRG